MFGNVFKLKKIALYSLGKGRRLGVNFHYRLQIGRQGAQDFADRAVAVVKGVIATPGHGNQPLGILQQQSFCEKRLLLVSGQLCSGNFRRLVLQEIEPLLTVPLCISSFPAAASRLASSGMTRDKFSHARRVSRIGQG